MTAGGEVTAALPGPTCERGVLHVHGLEPAPRPEYRGGNEGADRGRQERDVRVDVGPGLSKESV